MKRLILIALIVFAAACQNTSTATPASGTGPAPTEFPTIMVLPTLTPVPLTDPALMELKKQLQAGFEANDIDKLQKTISFSKWIASIYKAGGTMPIDPTRGLTLTEQFLKENIVGVDPERPTYEPNWSVNDAAASEFVLVEPKDGSAPYFAHILISHEPGGWRYTGIVTRIPYYDAPTIAQVRANPAKYQDREFMYVGTYEGKENPPTAAGAAPNDNAFILNTFAGPIWVTMSDAPYVLDLPADIASKKGQLARVFGTIKSQNGAPYLEADSVKFISPNEYAHKQGAIQKIDEKTRRVTLALQRGGTAELYLPALAFISRADGTRGELADLKVGQTVDAVGVPQSDGTLLVEGLYLK